MSSILYTTTNDHGFTENYVFGSVTKVFAPKGENRPMRLIMKASVYDGKKHIKRDLYLNVWPPKEGSKYNLIDRVKRMHLDKVGANLAAIVGDLQPYTPQKGGEYLEASVFSIQYDMARKFEENGKDIRVVVGRIGGIRSIKNSDDMRVSVAVSTYDKGKNERDTDWYEVFVPAKLFESMSKAGIDKGDSFAAVGEGKVGDKGRVSIQAKRIDFAKKPSND